MAELKRYRHMVYNSARWDGFALRPGDVVISTPPKCGTTWMQMLCAMLLHDTVQLDRPLSQISPWLDMQTTSREEVFAALQAQTGRRLIKTHTPLDGLALDAAATYVCVARDPRDVAISFDHHMANLDMNAFMAARAAAVGLQDLGELGPPPAPAAEDPAERFWQWADGEPGEFAGPTLTEVLHHAQTFWDHRQDPNVVLFHYADLQRDLPGQVRRLAAALGIDVTEARVTELAAAATFGAMKARADVLVPDVEHAIWISNSEFFHRGHSGQWREVLDEAGQRRYQERVSTLIAPDLDGWVHSG